MKTIEAQQMSNIKNEKKDEEENLKCIIIKLLKTSDRGNLNRREKNIMYRGTKIKITISSLKQCKPEETKPYL